MSVVIHTKPYGALLLACLLTACSSIPPHDYAHPFEKDLRNRPLMIGGLKIGLLADSRFQTPQSMHGAVFTSKKREEFIVNEELRPPALSQLTPDLLEYYLTRLIDEEQVDLIIYLGNVANNGCRDEVNAAFDVLRKYRDGSHERSGKSVPIFFVIGNHDYLGAGYTPHVPDRNVFCYDKTVTVGADLNNPIDKYELISIVHKFNRGNFGANKTKLMPGWQYQHNYEQQRLQTACTVRDKGRYQHIKAGCYYAGKLTYEDGSEILLVDTSDYFDRRYFSDITLTTKKWYGLTGWISTEDGVERVSSSCDPSNEAVILQAQWFECHRAEQAPPVRIIASHYPLKSLSLIGRPVLASSDVVCHLSSLFRPQPVLGNYWLAADTHVQPYLLEDRLSVGPCVKADEKLVVTTLNIGSTVDYDRSLVKGSTAEYGKMTDMSFAVDYEPSAVVVGIAGNGASESALVAKQVRIDVRTCSKIIDELRAQPMSDSPVYMPIRGKINYQKLFGLDAEFKHMQWTKYDQVNSMHNLDKLIDHLLRKFDDSVGLDEVKIKACIALESSRLAGGLQTRSFECESCPPWRMMRQIDDERSAHF